jgi:HEPN domain-containing protein
MILSELTANLDLGFAFSSRAKLEYRNARRNLKQFDYSECVENSQESIEFACKSICELNGIGVKTYKTTHDLSHFPSLLQNTLLTSYGIDLRKLRRTIFQWNNKTKQESRYGDQKSGRAAYLMFDEIDATSALQDAEEVITVLTKVEKRIKYDGKIMIGILDGFVKDPKREVRCPTVFNAGKFQSDDYEKYFSSITKNGQNKYEISRISISQINNKYSVIINPFGEAYPENDLGEYNCFRVIQNYITDGGIFVGSGGLLFFYGWDANHGTKKDISTNNIIVPESLTEGKLNFRQILDFSGTLLWKEFGIQTTFDTAVHSGSVFLKVIQTQADQEIVGHLEELGGTNFVNEYRAVINCPFVIPFLRSDRKDFKDIVPLGAIKKDDGYLILGGMNIKTDSEFVKICVSIDNFVDWISRQL